MASSKVEMEKSGEERELKHLGFLKMMALNAVVCVSHLYEYAKQNLGPLKSTLGTVENAVATIVGPVYERVRDLPDDVLVFLDNKVDQVTLKLDKFAPPLAKKVVNEVQSAVQKASKVAKDLVQEAQASGPRAAISHASALSIQFTISQLAVAWYKLDHFPPLHGVAEMAVPTAAHWSEKYNKLVTNMTAKGCSIFGYLPLVPVEEMAKAYKQVETGAAKKEDDDATSLSGSDSN